MSRRSRRAKQPGKKTRLRQERGKHGPAVTRQAAPSALLGVEELEERVMPSLLGQQLFPSNYPYNQNIANAPVAANSAAVIANIGGAKIRIDWGADNSANGNSPLYGIPFNIVHGNSTALVNVIINTYPGESDIVPVPIPANAVIEGDYQNGPNLNGPGYGKGERGDSHLIIWDEDNNIAYELYEASRPNDAVTATGGPTGGVWQAAQETVWNMNTNSFRTLGYTSADAAGLSILALLARPDEGLPVSQGGQGAIDHALRFTLNEYEINPQYIYPASHKVNPTGDPVESNRLPMGARLRLENTPAIDALISTMGPEAQIIATAMQQYGLILADVGSPMFVTGASASVDANNNISLTWNMNDVLGLQQLTSADFQVVNLTPIVTGLSATSGVAGNTITINGRNFSGAAGNLSVFFGSTLAQSVTFISETQITAVVPSGTGTVNVTVQSGADEVDNSNVNAPIFGYGTSAPSSAVLFTYGISPAPSLAGLPVVDGSSAVINIVSASGNGTTATITTDGTPDGFWVGELVTLTGVTPGGHGGLAGTVTVTGAPSATSFQFASTYSGSETFTATATASLAGKQRSMVDSIVYNFTEPVNLTAAAFSINVIVNNTATGSEVGVRPTLNVAAVPFTNEWVVTFNDPVNNSVIGNSIANGAYSITINPSLVTAVIDGQHLSAGETDTFYRLYGDVTGAQSVTNVDANAFNRAWGNAYYSAGYNASLDYNDDGKFTNIDANAFNRAFNTRYSVATTI